MSLLFEYKLIISEYLFKISCLNGKNIEMSLLFEYKLVPNVYLFKYRYKSYFYYL